MSTDWIRHAQRRGSHIRPRHPRFGRDDRSIETRLLLMETEDGNKWDGMMFTPRETSLTRTAALVIHGLVGNYLTGMPRRLAFGFAQVGIPVLTANTRMANYGAFFGSGLLEQVPLDIDAAVRTLRRRGFNRIVLVGYSMGSTMVTHYQAKVAPPEVVGVCTLAHPLSLPQSLRRRWERFGAVPDYNEMTRMVQRGMVGTDDPKRDRIVLVERASGPSHSPMHAEIWTYRTWWHSRGPEALTAESRRWVGVLRVPLGIIQAGSDLLIPRSEGPELVKLARDGGCPDVHLEYIDGADHVFTGAQGAAVHAARRWITGRLRDLQDGQEIPDLE